MLQDLLYVYVGHATIELANDDCRQDAKVWYKNHTPSHTYAYNVVGMLIDKGSLQPDLQ